MVGFIGCSSKKDSTSAAIPKLTYIMDINNTASTFYKCAVSADGITCGGVAQLIPTISSFALYKNANDWSMMKLKSLDYGCFEVMPSGDLTGVDSVTWDSNCALEGRLFDGTTTVGTPRSIWGPPGRSDPALYFTASFDFFASLTFQVVNKKTPGSACQTSVVSRVSSSASATSETESYTVEDGKVTFHTMFSLGADQATRNTTSTSRSQPFNFGYQPAVDSSALIAAGYTDDTITSFMTPQLGDFLLLKISNSARTFYCKAPDSITGTMVVPTTVMSNFSGSTNFYLTRYKYDTQSLGANVDFLVLQRIGMYTNGTDILGQSGGTVNVFVGD
jgi:hypothetical protein